jgi:hypothetical protein
MATVAGAVATGVVPAFDVGVVLHPASNAVAPMTAAPPIAVSRFISSLP